MSNAEPWRNGLEEAENLLRLGVWEEGWEKYAESAWAGIFDGLEIPELKNRPEVGVRVLVVPVGGIGDNIMCLRWFEYLRLAGAVVTYLCPESLCGLLEGHAWIDRLIPIQEGVEVSIQPNEYDFYVPIMALPRLIGERYARTYISPKHRPYVGLCTLAGNDDSQSRKRSMTRQQEMVLRSVQRVNWVPLDPELNDELKDWLATARVIRMLDAVVTVDTAVMHLAGAMGKPTYVLLRDNPDWKFGQDRKSCPFYTNVRAFESTQELVKELKTLGGS